MDRAERATWRRAVVRAASAAIAEHCADWDFGICVQFPEYPYPDVIQCDMDAWLHDPKGREYSRRVRSTARFSFREIKLSIAGPDAAIASRVDMAARALAAEARRAEGDTDGTV